MTSRDSSYLYKQLMARRRAAAQAAGEPCSICGQPINYAARSGRDSASVDHIRSWRDYPSLRYDPGNLAIAHLSCNVAKGARDAALPAHGNTSRDWSAPRP